MLCIEKKGSFKNITIVKNKILRLNLVSFQSIKDIQLFALTFGLAAVVVLVLIVWELVAPHNVVVRFLKNEVSS